MVLLNVQASRGKRNHLMFYNVCVSLILLYEAAAERAAGCRVFTLNVFRRPAQGVPMEDVMRVLRKRFGTSGIDEKAARPPKPAA